MADPTPGDLSARHVAVLHAFRDDYATYIPQFHAQNRKRMKLLLADLDAAIAALSALPAGGEPVAWCALNAAGGIAYFDGKPMVMPGKVGNEHHPTPLYTTPQPSAAEDAAVGVQGDGITAEWVMAFLPVNIKGWKGVPEGYMPGYNDALQLCRDGVRFAFAEHRALAAPAAGKGVDDAMRGLISDLEQMFKVALSAPQGARVTMHLTRTKAMHYRLTETLAALTRQPVAGDGVRAATPVEEAAIDKAAGLTKIAFRLPDALVNAVDEAAAREGLVRQAMLRSLIKRGLSTENIVGSPGECA